MELLTTLLNSKIQKKDNVKKSKPKLVNRRNEKNLVMLILIKTSSF